MTIFRWSLFWPLTCALLFQAGCALFTKTKSYTVEKNLVYKTTGDISLLGDIYKPDEPGLKPAVLVVHGGGWDARSGDMESICRNLAKAGFVAFNITYRLAPKSLFPSPVEDVRDALAWLRSNSEKFQIDPDQISGWGYSAGSHLILLVGLDPAQKLRAIVGGGTPADLAAWPDSPVVAKFLGKTFQKDPELWRDASPVNHVRADSPPVFLYHGEWDHYVEIQQMEKMQAALQAKGVHVETLRVSFLGHSTTYLFSQNSVDTGIEFLKKHNTFKANP